MKTLLSRAALAAAAMAFGLSGAAAFTMQTTGQLTVKLQVNGSCTVGSPTVNFTPQANSSLPQDVQQTASIGINCTPINMPYALVFDGGSSWDGSNRHMVSQADLNSKIPYDLLRDNFNGSSIAQDGFVSGSSSAVTVYLVAHVPAGAPTGTYQDNIVLTLKY
jgi:spore coat protein U-like protein